MALFSRKTSLLLLLAFAPAVSFAQAQWSGHGNDPQHTAISTIPTLSLQQIAWSKLIDENSPSEPILIHYGSPVATAANTIVVPVRDVGGQYCIEALNGLNGSTLWESMTDYVNAPSTGGWVPSLTPTLTPSGRLYYPGIGGTVLRVDDPNASTVNPVRLSFLDDYASFQSNYDSHVFISTPITSDAAGNIYFGYEVTAGAQGGLTSGIARIAPDGTAMHLSADLASGVLGASNLRVGTNSAPAVSLDGQTLYVALKGSTSYLAAINTATFAPQARIALAPNVFIHDAGTSSPTIGPDGDVYFGTLITPYSSNHFRGALQHFPADLSAALTPGSFGWDETVSIVPASMVPSYHGTSDYLLFSKYNDYKSAGGTGLNQLAILDPNDTQIDSITGQTVMKEVLTIAGVTSDGAPPAVSEWCINTAVVDPFTHSIIANSEDGNLYRWDLWTNSFTQVIELQAEGAFEAYTPTMVGPNGAIYAINKSVLFSVVPEPGSAVLLAAASLLLGCARTRRRSGLVSSF